MPRLSPVNQARWGRFRHNRRGYWSLWIFAVIFILSMCSELIANDKPLLVHFNDRWYVPVLATTAKAILAAPLPRRRSIRIRGFANRLTARLGALGPVRFGANSINYATSTPSRRPPRKTGWEPMQTAAMCWHASSTVRVSPCFWADADAFLKRDGRCGGCGSGLLRRKIDLWGQRVIEVWSGMPTLFLIILLKRGAAQLLVVTGHYGAVGWMALVGVVRAEFLRTRNFDYIRAAQALGSATGIIFRHMPQCRGGYPHLPALYLCSSITTLTSLDFLGFGLPLGSPSLGELLLQGKNNLQAPWLGITPFLSVAVLLC
jgi:microcin C transport system permease protein